MKRIADGWHKDKQGLWRFLGPVRLGPFTDAEKVAWQKGMDVAFLKLLQPLYDKALAHEDAMANGR